VKTLQAGENLALVIYKVEIGDSIIVITVKPVSGQ
jgi:hypothetical protein